MTSNGNVAQVRTEFTVVRKDSEVNACDHVIV
jgi:hypothetical protein